MTRFYCNRCGKLLNSSDEFSGLKVTDKDGVVSDVLYVTDLCGGCIERILSYATTQVKEGE
jgi:hypothetical protein